MQPYALVRSTCIWSRFPVDLNRATWRNGSQIWRKRMLRDWTGIIAVIVVVAASGQVFPWMHLGAMALAQCLTAFFAVWITHQGAEGLAGRSQRGVLARMAYLMFYHREHHLFPKVPVSRLPELARRLDQNPGYVASRKPVIPWLDAPT